MPAPINRLPLGLLDFLGIRSGGRYPQQLGEQLWPMLDISDWYKNAQSQRYATDSITFNANSNAALIVFSVTTPVTTALLTVPQDEIWLLLPGTAIHATFAADASAAAARVGMAVSRNAEVFTTLPSRSFGYDGNSATKILAGGATLATDFWLKPGEAFRGFQYGISAGLTNTVTVQAQLHLVRFKT